jgi:hypothetical protein
MRWCFACGVGLLQLSFGGRAEACGGVVAGERDLIVQAQQRVMISLRSDDTSQVVLELSIPSANAPFGALTPVGAMPTIDPEPVDVAELASLERATRPSVEVGDSDHGCSCTPFTGSDSTPAGASKGGVNVVQTVDIGPVTALVLTADSPAPLAGWLSDNGFVIPSTNQPFVDAYVGPGKFFIAFKRSSQAPAGPSSVGVSFSVAGDMRGYPLRMSRIGASSQLAIQVFVAAPSSVAPSGSAPSTPFVALTLADFAPDELAEDYQNAVFRAVSARSSKAFVVEGVFKDSWRSSLGLKLTRITEPDQVLTRLTSVVAPGTLDRDVTFDAPAPAKVPTRVVASFAPERAKSSAFALIVGAALLPLLRRTRRRKPLESQSR